MSSDKQETSISAATETTEREGRSSNRTAGTWRPGRRRLSAANIRFEIEGLWRSRDREDAQRRRHHDASSAIVACQEHPCFATATGVLGSQRDRYALASEV
jgi:hypothetical protein